MFLNQLLTSKLLFIKKRTFGFISVPILPETQNPIDSRLGLLKKVKSDRKKKCVFSRPLNVILPIWKIK